MSPEQIIENWVTAARVAAPLGFILPEYQRTVRR